jgi:hypothetical protein
LNSGNKDAKGLVTDGSSLRVVNDSTTDKVFKYTLPCRSWHGRHIKPHGPA